MKNISIFFKKNSFLNKGYFILMCHTVVKS